MQEEKLPQQPPGTELAGIINKLDRFGVAGILLADLYISGVGDGAAHEARAGTDHARQLPQVKLPSPKTTAGQINSSPSGIVAFLIGRLLKLGPGDELDGKAIDAMAGILCREAFAFEYMAQVAAAVVAKDFHTATVGIADFFDGAGDFVVEAWPATAAAEFVVAIVQRIIATAADEDAVDLEVVVLVGKRHFGAFTDNDVLFLGSEGVVIFWRFHSSVTRLGWGVFWGPRTTSVASRRSWPGVNPVASRWDT